MIHTNFIILNKICENIKQVQWIFKESTITSIIETQNDYVYFLITKELKIIATKMLGTWVYIYAKKMPLNTSSKQYLDLKAEYKFILSISL